MKEIKKLSDLMSAFISDINEKMERENKDVRIYDIWEEIKEKEKLPAEVLLEDVKNSFLIVKVSHPGVAQQIRMKKNVIINIFNARYNLLNLKGIKIILESKLKNVKDVNKFN